MLRSATRIASRMIFLAGLSLVLTAAAGALILVLAISSPQSPAGETLGRLAARLLSEWEPGRIEAQDSTHVYDYQLGTQVPRLYMLSIPKIALFAPVVASGSRPYSVNGQTVKSPEVPNAFAAGWSVESAPVGSPGNTVFVGHNNIFGEVFRNLGDLGAGDPIVVETENGERHYSVSQVIRLEERGLPLRDRLRNARWLAPTSDERLTLITCWPYLTNTHRLIVVALPQ